MRTLAEIEKRYLQTDRRIHNIFKKLQQGSDGQEAAKLAVEVSELLNEQQELRAALELFRDAAENLLSAECHGPH